MPRSLAVHVLRTATAATLLFLGGCGGGSDAPATPTTPVIPQPVAVASITIDGVPAAPIPTGSTATLAATTRDAAGAVLTGRTITWTSSAPSIAAVTAGGVVTAVAAGSTVITAAAEGRTATATITAVAVPTNLELIAPSTVLLSRDTMSLTLRVRDATGQVIAGGTPPTLQVDNAIVTISGTGLVTASATQLGRATITASLGALRATTTVTVAPGGGNRVDRLAFIDSIVVAEMAAMGTPGFQVAIAKDGQLVFARSYGYADTTTRRVMSNDALLRVGSTSKPLTAVAIMKLVQDGRLRLDDRVFDLLPNITPVPGRSESPATATLTVRDLLQHSQGYNVNREVDDSVWARVWRDRVLDPVEIARIGRSARYTTTPGSTYAYNNYGYQLLGRIIERVSGQSYERYVRESILTPAGVTDMALGRTPRSARLPLEATCYSPLPVTTSVYGTGAWCDVVPDMEYAEAAGGWVASATSMLRWIAATDGAVGGRAELLTPATVALMTARPSYAAASATNWTGLCWALMVESGGVGRWHSGAVTGGDAYVYRRADGMTIAILGNRTRALTADGRLLERPLVAALARVTSFPGGPTF